MAPPAFHHLHLLLLLACFLLASTAAVSSSPHHHAHLHRSAISSSSSSSHHHHHHHHAPLPHLQRSVFMTTSQQSPKSEETRAAVSSYSQHHLHRSLLSMRVASTVTVAASAPSISGLHIGSPLPSPPPTKTDMDQSPAKLSHRQKLWIIFGVSAATILIAAAAVLWWYRRRARRRRLHQIEDGAGSDGSDGPRWDTSPEASDGGSSPFRGQIVFRQAGSRFTPVIIQGGGSEASDVIT